MSGSGRVDGPRWDSTLVNVEFLPTLSQYAEDIDATE